MTSRMAGPVSMPAEPALPSLRDLLLSFENVDGASDRVAVVQVNVPPLNPLAGTTIAELHAALDAIEARPSVKAVVLAGAGPKAFVAGADIKEFLACATPGDVQRLVDRAHHAFRRLETFRVPVVAALHGFVLGGGNEIQMSCHASVAEAGALIGQPEINLFLMPGYGGTQRLTRLAEARLGDAGIREAAYLMLDGRARSASEAHALGFVDEVVPPGGRALDRALELARAHARSGRGALADAHARRARLLKTWAVPGRAFPDLTADGEVRRLLDFLAPQGRAPVAGAILGAMERGYDLGFTRGLEEEGRRFAAVCADPQLGKKGIRLFLEKRSPPLPDR